jgi:hypothetical protein
MTGLAQPANGAWRGAKAALNIRNEIALHHRLLHHLLTFGQAGRVMVLQTD